MQLIHGYIWVDELEILSTVIKIGIVRSWPILIYVNKFSLYIYNKFSRARIPVDWMRPPDRFDNDIDTYTYLPSIRDDRCMHAIDRYAFYTVNFERVENGTYRT